MSTPNLSKFTPQFCRILMDWGCLPEWHLIRHGACGHDAQCFVVFFSVYRVCCWISARWWILVELGHNICRQWIIWGHVALFVEPHFGHINTLGITQRPQLPWPALPKVLALVPIPNTSMDLDFLMEVPIKQNCPSWGQNSLALYRMKPWACYIHI